MLVFCCPGAGVASGSVDRVPGVLAFNARGHAFSLPLLDQLVPFKKRLKWENVEFPATITQSNLHNVFLSACFLLYHSLHVFLQRNLLSLLS